MKLKSLLVILIGVMALQATAPAWAESPAPPTAAVQVGGLDAFGYWFAKKFVIDMDATLQDQGIASSFCTFRQNDPTQDFSYRGVGPCLYKDFIKSMKTDDMAGVVYAWIKDRHGRYHPVEIQWRPPHGGWIKLIQQVVEMRLETPLYSLREKLWGLESAEKIRYTEFLGGDLKIVLPADPEALEVLASRRGSWVKNYLAKVDSMSLRLEPRANDKGKVIYSGALVMSQRALEGATAESTRVSLRTNVNVVILKRPFFLQAKVRSNGESQDPSPILGSEALP